MSRSRRKNPIVGITTATSEKKDKRAANRLLRRITRIDLHKGKFEALPILREISNVWDFAKDGKQRLDEPTPRDFRK